MGTAEREVLVLPSERPTLVVPWAFSGSSVWSTAAVRGMTTHIGLHSPTAGYAAGTSTSPISPWSVRSGVRRLSALSASNWTAARPPCEVLASLDTEDVVNGEVVQFRKRPAAHFLGFSGGDAINAQ